MLARLGVVLLAAAAFYAAGAGTVYLIGRGAMERTRSELRAGAESLDTALSQLAEAEAAGERAINEADGLGEEVTRLGGEISESRAESEGLVAELAASRADSSELTSLIVAAEGSASGIAGEVPGIEEIGREWEAIGDERRGILDELRRRWIPN